MCLTMGATHGQAPKGQGPQVACQTMGASHGQAPKGQGRRVASRGQFPKGQERQVTCQAFLTMAGHLRHRPLPDCPVYLRRLWRRGWKQGGA